MQACLTCIGFADTNSRLCKFWGTVCSVDEPIGQSKLIRKMDLLCCSMVIEDYSFGNEVILELLFVSMFEY